VQFVKIPNRSIIRISGEDRIAFLQGLVSNDVRKTETGAAIYTCFLTPQGKFLHDFYLISTENSLLLTPEAARAEDLRTCLQKYKLRSKITLEHCPQLSLYAVFGSGDWMQGVLPNPKHPALGGVVIAEEGHFSDLGDIATYDRLRITLGVPDGSRDMPPEHALLLENNIDQFHGIDWQKGCYMGQELTARTKYRALLKKRLVPLWLTTGIMPDAGTPLLVGDAEAGTLCSTTADVALGLVRRDYLIDEAVLTAGAARLTFRQQTSLS
jgi:folate-binding protein YgfZ